jgi:hypothetical protein
MGAGAFFGWKASWARKKAASAAGWPSVEGVVLESKVVENERPEESSATPTYRAVVEYRYEAGGEEHTGNKVEFLGAHYYSEEAAGAVVARYPAGERVRVYHDAGNPGDSVLEPGNLSGAKTYGILMWVLLGVGLALIGAAVWVIRE